MEKENENKSSKNKKENKENEKVESEYEEVFKSFDKGESQTATLMVNSTSAKWQGHKIFRRKRWHAWFPRTCLSAITPSTAILEKPPSHLPRDIGFGVTYDIIVENVWVLYRDLSSKYISISTCWKCGQKRNCSN